MQSSASKRQDQVPPKTLSDLPVGTHGVVRGLCGGREFIGRVAVLGFTVGAKVTAIQNYVSAHKSWVKLEQPVAAPCGLASTGPSRG